MAFLHSPASDIQQLKVLLKEQYTDLAAILIETPATNADPLWAAITDRVRRATVTLPSAD